ncbi:MAG: AAA family ATPase [Defluviitaleaceae bacterium]|nr:AAA family ATPase [Defluviitaleaceae bacterium]
MAIKSIDIKNFTVFEDFKCTFSPGVNVFIGENGTGKTHLLKMLYSFCVAEEKYKNPAELKLSDIDFLMILGKCYQGIVNLNPNSAFTFQMYDSYFSYQFDLHESGINIQSTSKFKNSIPSVFIPPKDMLTHSKGLLPMLQLYSNSMPFDKTVIDIIAKANQWSLDNFTPLMSTLLPVLENVINGKIINKDDEFYIKREDGKQINFAYEAEGMKKFGLLWQLLRNGSINNETILIWDEPEANINPVLIPVIVDILLELARHGVQIFVASHDYFFPQYNEVLSEERDAIKFHSLYKTNNGVKCESSEKFSTLENNNISNEKIKLYNAKIEKVMQ